MRKPTGREYFWIVVLTVMGLAYLAYRDEGFLGGRQDEDKKNSALGIAPIVRMAALAARTEDYDPKGRNLFEYYTPPRPKPPPRPVVKQPVQPKRDPAVRPVNRNQQKHAPVNAGITPPRMNFKYIGFLGPKDAKIAVFEDGEGMLLARAGEIVEKDFTVVEFKYESVVMGYVDTRFKDMTTELNMRRN
jgi:hypothetical protein